jgi:hypothetical protein
MRKLLTILWFGLVICFSVVPVASAQKHMTYGLIRCESINYQRSFCPADTRMGVKLARQISESSCIRGRTWWRDERGIVVTEGCAAEFEIGYRQAPYVAPPSRGGGGYVRPDRLVCESRDYARRYCPADIAYGAATLTQQISDTRCIYGRNWGYDRRGVWVDDGCGGEFEIGYADNAWRSRSQDVRWVRCESRDYRQSVCEARRNRGVELVRQVSRSACIEGDTWGYDRNRIWVTEGCAADFEVR